jgi:dihydrofolate reductase
MRKIVVFTNISLDGFFEAPGHDISGFKNDMEAFSNNPGGEVDTLLFGRRTYEMMKFWSTPQASQAMPEVARFFNERQKVVASHQAFDPGWNNVLVLSGDVPAQVRALKEQPGNTIMIFGSSTLCASLLAAGLLDELQIVVNPVVFSQGTTLFSGLDQRIELALTATRAFKSGAVMLIYTPLYS